MEFVNNSWHKAAACEQMDKEWEEGKEEEYFGKVYQYALAKAATTSGPNPPFMW